MKSDAGVRLRMRCMPFQSGTPYFPGLGSRSLPAFRRHAIPPGTGFLPSPKSGPNRRLCNSLLHKFPGAPGHPECLWHWTGPDEDQRMPDDWWVRGCD